MDDVHLFTSYFTEIKFGFTPIITRSNFLHSVLEQVQIDQILSETDSPYFIPEEVLEINLELLAFDTHFSYKNIPVLLILVWSTVWLK